MIDRDPFDYRRDKISKPTIDPIRPAPNASTGMPVNKNVEAERPKGSLGNSAQGKTGDNVRPTRSAPVRTYPDVGRRKRRAFNYGKAVTFIFLPLLLVGTIVFIVFKSSQSSNTTNITEQDIPVIASTNPGVSVSPPASTVGSNEDGNGKEVNWSNTARMIAVVDGANDPDCPWFGSGTIVGDGSFVLTNAHVAIQDDGVTPCELYIYLSASENDVPTDGHKAVVASFDVDLDLAVLRIIDSSLQPFSPIGVSEIELATDGPELGEELTVIGFPAMGGQRVTLTRGNYAGLTDDSPPYYKTDAMINGGNSGGGAFNSSGQLVGVPSAVQFDDTEPGQTALGLIRPIKDALQLLEKASNAPLNASSANQLQESGFIGIENDETDPRFQTCKEAKSNGYGPYYSGVDVEYDWYRDRDGDGIVCE